MVHSRLNPTGFYIGSTWGYKNVESWMEKDFSQVLISTTYIYINDQNQKKTTQGTHALGILF